MLDINIPEINATAGNDSDGIVIGKINQSNVSAVLYGSALVTVAQVLRKDITSTGSLWTDVTTAATDSTTGDFQPFGTLSTISLGDAFYIRTLNDVDTHAIYAQISTAGVGSWTILVKEWDTVTETWGAVSGLLDMSNGFKAGVGVYKISYSSGTEGRIRLDDVSPKYIWHKIELATFTSASVVPVLSRIWMADSVINLSNVTAAYTSSPADFSSLPSEELPVIGNHCMVVHAGIPIGEEVTITSPRSTNYTVERQYLATDGTWKPMTMTSDPSNGYTASAGSYRVRWTPASDWTSKTVTDKDNNSYTGWVERCHIMTVTTEGPVTPPHVQSKSRALGSGLAEGIYHYAAKTYSGVSFFETGVPSSSTVTITFMNSDTGIAQIITIPSNTRSSATVTNGRFNFASNLTIGAGQSLIVSHGGGGSLQDVRLKLQEVA